MKTQIRFTAFQIGLLAVSCGIILYVTIRMFWKSTKDLREGFLPPFSSIQTMANTAGVAGPPDVDDQVLKDKSKTDTQESNPLPVTNKVETPAPITPGSNKYEGIRSNIEFYEKNRENLDEFIHMVHGIALEEYNTDPNTIYNEFDPMPDDLKPRILKLAATNTDFRKIIEKDSHFNEYAYVYEPPDEPGDKADYHNLRKLPLKEYFIKGSYNSAYDGMAPSLVKLKEVLYDGCRYLDLQVFAIDDPKTKQTALYVGHSEEGGADSIDTTVSLYNALTYINSYAFSRDQGITTAMTNGNAPQNGKSKLPSLMTNYANYPLFLMLRIHRASPDNKSPDVIQMLYDNYLNPDNDGGILSVNKLHTMPGPDGPIAAPVSGDTSLREIRNKIILCMDIDNVLQNYTTTFDANDVPNITKEVMRKFVNVKTSGHTWKTIKNYATVQSGANTPLVSKNENVSGDHSYETNVKNWFLALPSVSDSGNPDAILFATQHKIQVTPNRYYLSGPNLDRYNDVFDYLKSPMVSMSQLLAYTNST